MVKIDKRVAILGRDDQTVLHEIEQLHLCEERNGHVHIPRQRVLIRLKEKVQGQKMPHNGNVRMFLIQGNADLNQTSACLTAGDQTNPKFIGDFDEGNAVDNGQVSCHGSGQVL